MAGFKEIKNKIKSVQSTRKITKAMEMVAASKMKKAQDRMRASRPYVIRALQIAMHIAKANTEYKHPFLARRENVRRVGAIVITTDKGLGFLTRMGGEIVSSVVQLGDRPHVDRMIGPVKVLFDKYIDGTIDEVHIYFTNFVNTMKQVPRHAVMLPIPDEFLTVDGVLRKAEVASGSWDYIYEPDAKVLLDGVLRRYVEAIVFQMVNENMASEQSARMVAMKAASDNAATIIDELQLIYNKSRQAAITKELAEIVGGAAAV